MINRLLSTSIFFLILSQSLSAQENTSTYKTAIGIRLGPSVPAIKSGITVKHFMNDNAIEGIVSFGNGIAICGLYEIHKPLATDNLKWFTGFGAYAGFTSNTSNIGAAGIVGLDYKFDALPLNISLDWKPELNIITRVGFEASTVGFSARFTF
jgi:hypothetical protein